MENKLSQKTKSILSIFIAIIMVTLSIAGSIKIMTPAVVEAASKPTISRATRSILIGKKYNLNINDKIAGSKYKWTSSDEEIATVNSKGIVTAKSKGLVNVTCTITTPDKTVYRVTSKVTVREPALHFRISNKISALNLGQEYDLNRRLAPSSSNDRTTWTSSDESIAKPDSMGRFIASKEGIVTITGTTMSGKSDSVTITVVDEEGIVTNQEELDALVGSGAELITLKTDEEIELDIIGSRSENQTLVVDAPNATIKNRGVFKVIEIKQIKSDTWYERAVGNLLRILDKEASIVIASYASVSIEVNEEDAVLRIENNGVIEEIIINKKSDIEITGKSKEEVPVTVNVKDVKIKTSVPLNLYSKAKFELEILPGGEKTTVNAANKNAVPTIKGNASIKVVIGDEEEEVKGQPVPTPIPSGGGGGGGGNTPDPGPKSKTYDLKKKLDEVTSVTVKYGNIIEYTVDSEMLNVLRDFLNNKDTAITTWKDTTEITKTYSGVEVEVTGTKGSSTKTVTFKNNILAGSSFEVKVNEKNNSVTLTSGSGTSFTVKKLDDQSISISPVPTGLEFTAN